MRLIDADAVIPKGTIVTDDVIAVHFALAKAPTIDAVPVVRCKDCASCGVLYPTKRIGEEAMPRWYCGVTMSYIRPDDFCSYGEKRGGDDE